MLRAAKQRMSVARELDKLKLDARKEVQKIKYKLFSAMHKCYIPVQEASKSWWKRAAEEADLHLSDGEMPDDDDDENEEEALARSKRAASNKARMAAKQAELSAMLQAPLSFGSGGGGGVGKYPTKSGRLELPADMAGWSGFTRFDSNSDSQFPTYHRK